MLKKSFIENFYQSDFIENLNHNLKDTDKNIFSHEEIIHLIHIIFEKFLLQKKTKRFRNWKRSQRKLGAF